MRKLIQENATEALRIFLKRLNVRFTERTIEQFREHPDFPSLLSLTYILNRLGIDHLAMRASYAQLQHELPKPVLVHLLTNGGMFLVIAGVDEDNVQVVNEYNRLESQPKEDFLKSWSGIALVADNENPAIEEDYERNKTLETLGKLKVPLAFFSFILLVFCTVYILSSDYSLSYYSFLFSKLIGVALSIPLLIYEFDKNNLLVKKLCTPNGKTDCSTVLDSPASKLMGLISWSDIGLIYFLTGFFYLLFFPSITSVGIVSMIAVGAALFIPYSIYYQWKVAGSWCGMCLLVQGVLLIEFFLAVGQWQNPVFNREIIISSGIFSLLLFLTSSVWGLLKPIFFEWETLKHQRTQWKKIKFNRKVFELLSKETPTINRNRVRPILFGNPKGEHVLTLVTNPVCRHCRDIHRSLFHLLKVKKNTKVEEIFLTGQHEEDASKKIAETMLQFYGQHDQKTFEKSLSEFYDAPINKERDWIQKYAEEKQSHNGHITLEEHIDWCKKEGISSTPQIFYNGKRLPEGYSFEDLDLFID